MNEWTLSKTLVLSNTHINIKDVTSVLAYLFRHTILKRLGLVLYC